jgi:FkbM family methyltransferase
MERAQLNLALGSTNRPFFYRPKTSDEGVINQIFKQSDYNLGRLRRGNELTELCNRIAVTRSPLIIDAGANIGASAVYFAYSFPKAQVVAIEPEQSNFDLLKANTEGTSVQCIHAALHATAGQVNVVDTGQGYWGFRTVGSTDASIAGVQDSQSANCTTINDIYESQAHRCAPFMVKIDIEGGESDLFSANTEWVAKTPLIIIELHDWLLPGTANSRTFLQCIAGHNRDFVHIGENVFSIDNDLMPN